MADSFSSFDVARLAFDGTDNSTTVTDALGHTFTALGTAKLKTTRPRFGTASLLVDNTDNSCVYSANSTDWNMGSGDFCVDMFFTGTTQGVGDGTGLFGISDGTITAMRINQYFGGLGDMTLEAKVSIAGAVTTLTSNDIATWYGTDYHVSLAREGSTLNLLIDGMLAASATISGALDWNTNMVLTVGQWWNAMPTQNGGGYIDQFRLTKGAARYRPGYSLPVDGNFNTYDTVNIITTSQGANTKQVAVYGTSSHDAVIAAVDAAVVSFGWEIYDSLYKGVVTKVYRRLNADGVSYKYALLVWDKTQHLMTLTSCESWDRATKAITNETWSNLRANGQMGFALNSCDIMIFGSANYLGMMTYVQGSPSNWAMCVEVEREAPEDTGASGFPCWGMIYAESFLHRTITGVSDFIRFPRTRDGFTGVNASRNWGQITSLGAWGTSATYAVTTTSWNTKFNTAASTGRHGWDNSKKSVSSVKMVKDDAATDTTYTPYGRLYGVKAAPHLGEIMDRVALPVDANMFYSGYGDGGVDRDHWILPTVIPAQSQVSGSGTSFPAVTVLGLGANAINGMCSTGLHAYCASNTAGVYKVNLTTGVGALVAGTSGACTDIVFDGRYVYATTTTGIARIDTTNADAVTNLTVGTGGTKALCLQGKQFLWASQRTAATVCVLFKIDLFSFTSVASVNLTARTTASVVNAIAFNGVDTIAAPQGNSTTATDTVINFVNVDTLTPSVFPGPVVAVSQAQGIFWTGAGWMYSIHTDASGDTLVYLSGNTGTQLYASGSLGCTTNTAGPAGRVFLGRYSNVQYAMTGTAVASVPSGDLFGAYCMPDLTVSSAAASVGSSALTTTAGGRAMLMHGNSIMVAGVDNNLYVGRNITRRSSGSQNNSQVLLPK